MELIHRKRQTGEALLFTLLAIVVIFLGFLYAMRNVVSNTTMTGNNLARQKNVQVADIALRNLQQIISDRYGGLPLEVSTVAEPWWRTGTPITIPAAYWNSCLGNTDKTARCGNVPVSIGNTALNYQALAVVQASGRAPDVSACPDAGQDFVAYYYDIYIYVQENPGVTTATTETVHKLCVKDQSSNR